MNDHERIERLEKQVRALMGVMRFELENINSVPYALDKIQIMVDAGLAEWDDSKGYRWYRLLEGFGVNNGK